MPGRSSFFYFASVLATALFLLPAQAATSFEGAFDPALMLSSLSAEAQGLSVSLVGP